MSRAADMLAEPGAPMVPNGQGQRRRAWSNDVLLVEDDDLVRYAVKRLLVSGGRECVAAATVEDAQQLLALHAPALTITDFNLSGRWTGVDLLAWMRSSPRLRGVPMLLMTGDDRYKVRGLLDAARLDDVDILSKPFEKGELMLALARLHPPDSPRTAGGS
jgi:CheY-like chemotaxis protein